MASLAPPSSSRASPPTPLQLPFVVLASAGGGLLGAAFNLLRIRLRKARTGAHGPAFTVAWAAGVAAVTVLTVLLLPAAAGRCLAVPPEWATANVIRLNWWVLWHCERECCAV